MKMTFSFLLSIILISTGYSKEKLLQVIAVSRHGVRAPNNKIPSLICDPFKEIPGQITDFGNIENYNSGELIGYYLREKFGKDPEYKLSEYKFIATEEFKTLSSVNNLYRGIFSKQSDKTSFPV